jgi:type II secretory pathway pseudopilin PulG
VHRRKAFTVIELLLVIGVLIILAGVVVWGLSAASSSNAAKSTRTTLQNLQSMSEELNRKSRLAGFEVIYTFVPPPPVPGAEVAPSLVSADSPSTDRFGPSVGRTSVVITRLASIPDNKRVLDKFPADQLMSGVSYTFPDGTTQTSIAALDGWRNPILFVPATGLQHVAAKAGEQSTHVSGQSYPRGARVIHDAQNAPYAATRKSYWTANEPTASSPPSPADAQK